MFTESFAPRLRLFCLLSLLVVGPYNLVGATAGLGERAAAAVRAVLTTAASGTPESRVRLLDAALVGNRITLNFSGEVHELGLGSRRFEEFAHEIDEAASAVLRDHLTAIEFELRIGGVPLHILLEKLDRDGAPATARDTRRRSRRCHRHKAWPVGASRSARATVTTSTARTGCSSGRSCRGSSRIL